ncbi:hypothetical protein BaRGS_00035048, partial [Batillaria attramentaria]
QPLTQKLTFPPLRAPVSWIARFELHSPAAFARQKSTHAHSLNPTSVKRQGSAYRLELLCQVAQDPEKPVYHV